MRSNTSHRSSTSSNSGSKTPNKRKASGGSVRSATLMSQGFHGVPIISLAVLNITFWRLFREFPLGEMMFLGNSNNPNSVFATNGRGTNWDNLALLLTPGRGGGVVCPWLMMYYALPECCGSSRRVFAGNLGGPPCPPQANNKLLGF